MDTVTEQISAALYCDGLIVDNAAFDINLSGTQHLIDWCQKWHYLLIDNHNKEWQRQHNDTVSNKNSVQNDVNNKYEFFILNVICIQH